MYIFEVVTFFLTKCLSNLINFSVVVRIYKILDFDEAFFFLATVAMITENVSFSSLHCNHCRRNKFFNHNHAAYQSQLFLKKWSQTNEGYPDLLLQRCIFYPVTKAQNPNDGVKMQ